MSTHQQYYSQLEITMPEIMPGAEPFFIPANPGRTGVLLVHGFTATPHQMLDLGRYLAARGITVMAPRLAGHATSPRDMERTDWEDWYASLLDAYFMLRPNVEALWAVGLSLGALLCLHLAAHQPIAGVAALSTPLTVRDQRLMQLGRVLPVRYIRKRPDEGPHDPNLDRYISYRVYPVHNVTELLAFQKVVREELPRVTVPALLIHSRTDTLAPPENMPLVHSLLGSNDKAMHWLPESDHIITMDSSRVEVSRLIHEFVTRRA